jgi:hypothetical protein
MDLVDAIIQYESGDLDVQGLFDLFAELIRTGQAWTLQGSYGRTARRLIDGEWISSDGEILRYPEETQ